MTPTTLALATYAYTRRAPRGLQQLGQLEALPLAAGVMAKLPVGKLGSPGEDEGTRPARPNAKARELTATELARGSTEDLKPAGPGAGGKPTAKLSNRPKDVAKAIAATIQARRGTLRPSLVSHFRVPAGQQPCDCSVWLLHARA